MVGDGKGPGEGSGLLQVHPKDFRPIYESSRRRLTWPNGHCHPLHGTEPDQLRGPEHDGAWIDELAKFALASGRLGPVAIWSTAWRTASRTDHDDAEADEADQGNHR